MSDARRTNALTLAIELLNDEGHEDQAEELETLKEMFASHKGDDPSVAQARRLMPVTCKNCGHIWSAMATPAPLGQTALVTQRLCQCARCFATEGIMLTQV